MNVPAIVAVWLWLLYENRLRDCVLVKMEKGE